MKINMVDNKLQIICENSQDLDLAQDWKNYNIRQYKHNDDRGYVVAFDRKSVEIINMDGKQNER